MSGSAFCDAETIASGGLSPRATSHLNTPSKAGAWLLRSGPIIVAVSGEPAGAAPVRVTAALERRYRCPISAIHVLEVSDRPILASVPDARTFSTDVTGDVPYAEDARSCRQQVGDWLGQSNVWPVHVSSGAAAYEIARYADEEGARLIVMGLRRHEVAGHDLRDETTLTVARLSNRPVLAVTPRLFSFPKRAVVGIDFGPTSVLVARAALDVLRSPMSTDPIVLRLVYVDQSAGAPPDSEPGETLTRHLGIDAAFDQLVRSLAAPPGVHVESVSRRGGRAAELLACADRSRADLFVVGGFGKDARARASHPGNVTTEVIRDGRCSVLVIPPESEI